MSRLEGQLCVVEEGEGDFLSVSVRADSDNRGRRAQRKRVFVGFQSNIHLYRTESDAHYASLSMRRRACSSASMGESSVESWRIK
jgi:hypothetical protein